MNQEPYGDSRENAPMRSAEVFLAVSGNGNVPSNFGPFLYMLKKVGNFVIFPENLQNIS